MGIVYKILCNETGECYIGSANNKTCYTVRRSKHRTQRSCSSKQIIDRGNYTFSIIEENIFIDTELRQREQYWIDTSDHVINKLPAFQLVEVKEEKRKKSVKVYHENHKEEIKKYKSEWFQSNKERLRDRYSERITCECGSEIRKAEKSRHIKSTKHQDYLKLCVDIDIDNE